MFIAATSGSGAATTAAVGSALLPQLKERGYDLDFSAALIASAERLASLSLRVSPWFCTPL